MARLGLITAEFGASSLEGALDRIVAAGASSVQLDLVNAVGHSFPETLPQAEATRIRSALTARGVEAAALSGTYNMIHPDAAIRERGAADLDRLIGMAPALGVKVVTLCTGTRDTGSMWRVHPGNEEPSAWRDLQAQLERALATAERHGIVLGVEPEIANTVSSIEKARRLLDEMASPSLKIVMDGANIFQAGQLPRMRAVLDRAFDLLGHDIALAHAKDLDRDGDAGHLAAGRGKLDYPYYLELLHKSGFEGAIILHSLTQDEAADRIRFVRDRAPHGYVVERQA